MSDLDDLVLREYDEPEADEDWKAPVPGEARWRGNTATRPGFVPEPHMPDRDDRHLYHRDYEPGWQGGRSRYDDAKG